MAHIANCVADAGDERTISPPPALLHPNDTIPSPAWSSWRMQQPQPERKYQLFPKTGPLPPLPIKSVNPERILGPGVTTVPASTSTSPSPSPAQSGAEPKTLASSLSLRLKIKEHGLIRRRKISVPDLGPMTTVQEGMVDSPTIPGRPPVHERSASAPGHKPSALEGVSFFFHDSLGDDIPESEVESPCLPTFSPSSVPLAPTSNPQAVPQKQLAPLVIPQSEPPAAPKPTRMPSRSRNRSGSAATDAPRRPPRPDDPPHLRGPTSIPLPSSAITTAHPTFCLPTPISTSVPGSRSSPKPWETVGRTTPTPTSAPIQTHTASDGNTTPSSEAAPMHAPPMGHRRNHSESGSIMDRGRPRNRHDRRVGAPVKRTEDKGMTSVERKAFETLPEGTKASDAPEKIPQSEIDMLYQQALGQAARFQVLRQEDVEALSRELRQLDERTEYLRRTYTSLRAGRRNLHARICQYLRSPLVASFRSESMLKQEEALAELDASIDDWIGKLEQAENRRTRVRQKLLEHVCAATTLDASPAVTSVPAAPAAIEPLHSAMCIQPAPPPPPPMGVGNISTPPRSPSKSAFERLHSRNASSDSTASSSSPHRGAATAHVPSTIFEQPMVEEVAAVLAADNPRASCLTRDDVESIRIYADSDVYALLADVENEFTKMSADMAVADSSFPYDTSRFDAAENDDGDYDDECRLSQSEELLFGLIVSAPNTAKPMPLSPLPPPAPSKNSPALPPPQEELVYLTSAVFKPQRPTATA